MIRENIQPEFDRLVSRGIILGTVWILGVGSIISLISAYQANNLIKESGVVPEGKNRIIKCLVIGISGLLVWVIAILIIVFFRHR